MLISFKCGARSVYSFLWKFLKSNLKQFFLIVKFCNGANSSTQTSNMLFYLYVEILESCITSLLIDSLIGTQNFSVFSFFRFPFSELNRKCTLMFEKKIYLSLDLILFKFLELNKKKKHPDMSNTTYRKTPI